MNANLPQKKLKRFLRCAVKAFYVLYFGGYFFITLNGTYLGPYPPPAEKQFLNGDWLFLHRYIWQPYGARLDRYGKINFLGAVYSPLILLDRTLWHHDKFAL